MFLDKKRETGTTKLGEILVEAGVITTDLVTQSLSIAKNARLPIGRVLSMYGLLNEKVIESAVAAQTALRDGRFNRAQASQLVRVAYTSHADLAQAQSLVSLGHASTAKLSELGRILLASALVEEAVLEEAQALSDSTKTPLGQILLTNESISLQVLVNTLHLLLLCREKSLPAMEAVAILQLSYKENISVPESAQRLSLGPLPEQKDTKLAAFLILAQIVDQKLVLTALEESVEKQMFFGNVLLEKAALTPRSLDAAIHLQEMVEHELLSVAQACDIFSFVTDLNAPLDNLLVEFERLADVAKFILASGYLSESQCQKHDLNAESNDILIGIALLRTGLINDKVLSVASGLEDLIKLNQLSQAEAIKLFRDNVDQGIESQTASPTFRPRQSETMPS